MHDFVSDQSFVLFCGTTPHPHLGGLGLEMRDGDKGILGLAGETLPEVFPSYTNKEGLCVHKHLLEALVHASGDFLFKIRILKEG